MTKKLLSLLIITALILSMVCAVSAETVKPGYALRFNNQETLTKLGTGHNVKNELKDGYTTFTSLGHDPQYAFSFSATDVLDANTLKFAQVKYRTTCKEANVITELFFSTADSSFADAGNRKTITPVVDGNWNTAVVNFGSSSTWKGNLKDFRIDPLQAGTLPADQSIDIEYIAFFATEANATAFDGVFAASNPATNDSFAITGLVIMLAASVVLVKKKLEFN